MATSTIVNKYFGAVLQGGIAVNAIRRLIQWIVTTRGLRGSRCKTQCGNYRECKQAVFCRVQNVVHTNS
jgi:hypothetical protein